MFEPFSGRRHSAFMKTRAYVYILASQPNGTLYIGVTSDIARRMVQHREGTGSAFTRKYAVHRLVYAEPFDRMDEAIQREKQLKHWNRAWKIRLINEANPEWQDIYPTING